MIKGKVRGIASWFFIVIALLAGQDAQGATPELHVAPASRDFGEVIVGDFLELSFVVTNFGVVGSTLMGEASLLVGDFSIVGESAFELEAGAGALVIVRFSPTATGFFSQTVTFISNGGDFMGGFFLGTGVDHDFCFIATAAFGTPLAEEVEVLSRLRDEYFLTNELGQRFVVLYKRHSPALAEFISEREWCG